MGSLRLPPQSFSHVHIQCVFPPDTETLRRECHKTGGNALDSRNSLPIGTGTCHFDHARSYRCDPSPFSSLFQFLRFLVPYGFRPVSTLMDSILQVWIALCYLNDWHHMLGHQQKALQSPFKRRIRYGNKVTSIQSPTEQQDTTI